MTMIKKLSVAVAVLAGFLYVPNIHAATVGSVDTDNVTRLLGGSSFTAHMFDLTPLVLTDNATELTTNGGVYRKDGYYYYTNGSGLNRKTSTMTSSTTLKTGTLLNAITRQGNMLIVSNAKKTKDSTYGSFRYDLSTGKSKKFTPAVKEIIDASLTTNGKALAMIARNDDGKSRLFLSQDSLTNVREFPLPQYATTCDVIDISPNAKLLMVGCKFNIPNKPKGRHGYVVISINSNKTLGTQRRNTNQKQINEAEWLTNSKLVTIETDANDSTTMSAHSVTNNRTSNTSIIGADLAFSVDDRPMIATPLQVFRDTDDSFYYSFVYANADTVEPAIVATFIGYYNTITSTDSILVNNGSFDYLTGAW